MIEPTGSSQNNNIASVDKNKVVPASQAGNQNNLTDDVAKSQSIGTADQDNNTRHEIVSTPASKPPTAPSNKITPIPNVIPNQES